MRTLVCIGQAVGSLTVWRKDYSTYLNNACIASKQIILILNRISMLYV